MIYEPPDKGFNLVIHPGASVRAPNEALDHLLSSTPMEYTWLTFGSVAVTLLRTMEIASSNSFGVAYSLPPQRTRKPGQHLPFLNSHTFSAFSPSYRYMISTYLLELSPTPHRSLVLRYVFSAITRYDCSPSNIYRRSIPGVSSDAQGVAPLTPLETRGEGSRPKWC